MWSRSDAATVLEAGSGAAGDARGPSAASGVEDGRTQASISIARYLTKHARADSARHRSSAVALTQSGLLVAVPQLSMAELAAVGEQVVEAGRVSAEPRSAHSVFGRFLALKGGTVAPATVDKVVAWLVDRATGHTHERTGLPVKTSFLPRLYASLRRFMLEMQPGDWRIGATEEKTIERLITSLQAAVPAATEKGRCLTWQEIELVWDSMGRHLEGLQLLQARALFAVCIGCQARGEEVYDMQFADVHFCGSSTVLGLYMTKTAGHRMNLQHRAAPHMPAPFSKVCVGTALLRYFAGMAGYGPDWHVEGAKQAAWPVFGVIKRGHVTTRAMRGEDLHALLDPFMHGLGGDYNSHFGRFTGSALYEVKLRFPPDLVTVMGGWGGGEGGGETEYKRTYRIAGSRPEALDELVWAALRVQWRGVPMCCGRRLT